jgi:2-aminoadipate transaminase
VDPRIETLQRKAAADAGVIGLGGGLPADAQFPRKALVAAFLEALSSAGLPALQYGWPEGLASLREKIARRLNGRGMNVGPDDVIITNGAQQAIALSLELVCRPGQRIGVDAETYPAALDLFRSRGLRPHAGPGAFEALYSTPALANPRGTSLDGAARAQLLARRLPILEDEAYAELRFDGALAPPLAATAPQRVFLIGTFSKTLCPGLRVGWLVPPPRYRRRALRLKHDSDLQSNSLAQAIVDHVLAHDDFDERLVRLRRFYRRRASRLAAALKRHLPSWRFRFPEGGFTIWAEADDVVDEARFLAHATRHGVSFDPGSMFRADARTTPTAVRLSFAAAPGPELEEAVRRLARAWSRRREVRSVTLPSPSPLAAM